MSQISNIHAREIIDSRANPTIEVDITLTDGSFGRSAVPSGASTGTYEMLELRDGDKGRFLGKGVLKAVGNVNNAIKNAVLNKEFGSQEELDKLLIALDGTNNKGNLGANAILATSLAYAHAQAASMNLPFFKHINSLYGNPAMKLPRPMFNIMNGGKHANWATDIQEYMVIVTKEGVNYADQLRMACEVFLTLEKLLKDKKLSTNVGNEGGFAPLLGSNQEALDLMVQAVSNAGYNLGSDIKFGFDAAASEFYNSETKMYELKRDGLSLTTTQMVDYVENLSKNYPVASFEDMLAEDDWEGWCDLTSRVGNNIQIVGDDLLVTNVERIKKAIELKACNSLLMKVNQIGSLTESLDAMKLAASANWTSVVSHRSGETEDVSISHIAVGTGSGQIKTGAPSRGERTAKYNELIRIAEELE